MPQSRVGMSSVLGSALTLSTSAALEPYVYPFYARLLWASMTNPKKSADPTP